MCTFVKGLIMAICISSAGGCATSVRTGLDNIESYHSIFKDKRVGIITNHTAYDSSGKFIVDIFKGMDDAEVIALFSPEHGLEGLVDKS